MARKPSKNIFATIAVEIAIPVIVYAFQKGVDAVGGWWDERKQSKANNPKPPEPFDPSI